MAAAHLIVTAAQLNPTVGDVTNNVTKIRTAYLEADTRGSNLVITPELAVTGGPLDNLARSEDLLKAAETALLILQKATKGRKAVLIAGTPIQENGRIYNAAVALSNGERVAVSRQHSPSPQGIFDAAPASSTNKGESAVFLANGVRVGVLVGEDADTSEHAAALAREGAELLTVVAASPYRPRALAQRITSTARARTKETGLPLLYVNLVGGQDETVFDGGSFAVGADGQRLLQHSQWKEECTTDWDMSLTAPALPDSALPSPEEETWCAMVVGLRDYARKNGFADVVLGLSGGMDSAAAAAVAGDALGADHVYCVRLPSRHTSELSNRVAEEMCSLWGFSLDTIAISPVVDATVSVVSPGNPEGLHRLTMENMQARARGLILMTLSNEHNRLLLSTGNKSEIAVGYSTLYGDMCGGYNPLKDVYKTTVYAVSSWRNANRPEGLLGPAGIVIPQEIINRPPSAELSPGQLDTDSLPPYPELDAILHELVEGGASEASVTAKGYPAEIVARVNRLLVRSEFKRRQGAPGPQTTVLSFSGDRKTPLVNRFSPSMLHTLRSMLEN